MVRLRPLELETSTSEYIAKWVANFVWESYLQPRTHSHMFLVVIFICESNRTEWNGITSQSVSQSGSDKASKRASQQASDKNNTEAIFKDTFNQPQYFQLITEFEQKGSTNEEMCLKKCLIRRSKLKDLNSPLKITL